MRKKTKPSESLKLLVVFLLFSLIGTILIWVMRRFNYSWDCISTIISMLTFLATAVIPIIVIFIQRDINDNNDNNRANNLKFDQKITELKAEIEKIKNDSKLEWEDVKTVNASDVYDYICVSIRVTIKEIAEHFKVSTNEIKPIISLLCLRDNLIQSYIDVDPRNPEDDSVWFKKRN